MTELELNSSFPSSPRVRFLDSPLDASALSPHSSTPPSTTETSSNVQRNDRVEETKWNNEKEKDEENGSPTEEDDENGDDSSDTEDADEGRVGSVEEMRTEWVIAPEFPAEPDRSVELAQAPQTISVFAVTWNLHGLDWPTDLSPLLPRSRGRVDVFVIGTQECERTIEASLLIRSKARWETALRESLGEEYVLLRSHTMMAIHLVVFVRREWVHYISGVDSSKYSTGLLNGLIGNKGAVGICFRFGLTRLAFVSAHFHAHEENVESRNQDFESIDGGLGLWIPLDPHSPDSAPFPLRVSECFDRVVWLGDLNYRIQGRRKAVDHCLRNRFLEVLLNNDQLLQEQQAGRVFSGYLEGKIDFPPTYKFDVGTDSYDTSSKGRIPSWTDRILFRSNDKSGHPLASSAIRCEEYSSCSEIKTSDHRAVTATLLIDVDGTSDSIPKTSENSSVCLIL